MKLRLLLFSFFIMHFIHAQNVPYLARLHPGVTLNDLFERGVQAKYAYNFDPVKQPFLSSFIYISTSKTSFLDDLKSSGVLMYWEHSRTQQFYFEPSDPSFSLQWHLDKIMAPDAWDTAQGDSSFVVAVVDSGVDYMHDDLKDNLAYNYDDPINGLDDDNDGYIDNYYGWDFGSNDHDPMVDGTNFLAHGSSICGVAAASTNNAIGAASPAFNCRYLPVKITNSVGYLIDTNAGILYGAQMGAQVINCSFGSIEFSQAEADVIQYVTDSMDVLVVASAGNEGLNTDVYPAALDKVIGVCALDENDQKIPVSNYSENFDIAAPGASIYSPYVQNQYGSNSGTSVSAAIVSGSAILLRSHFPTENTAQITARLLNSTDDIYSVNQDYQNLLGTGRLNLASALAYDLQTNDTESAKNPDISVFPNPSSGQFNLTFQSHLGVEYQLSVFDVLGKLYYRDNFFATEENVHKVLSIKDLNRGYYNIQIVGPQCKMNTGIMID